MAMIIDLKRDFDPPQTSCLGEAGVRFQAAEIILFPGVRYERWADDEAGGDACGTMNKQQHPARPRDWLEI